MDNTSTELIKKLMVKQFSHLHDIMFVGLQQPHTLVFGAVDSEDCSLTIHVENEGRDDLYSVSFSDIDDEEQFNKVGFIVVSTQLLYEPLIQM